MTQELVYTSAPKGLKLGSRGFCTVASTRGMSKTLADRLEALSGYKHLFQPGPNETRNPANFSYVTFRMGGKQYAVLSRVGDAGLDYTQRANKIAHHVVLEPADLCEAGPAWMASQPGFLLDSWEGDPRLIDNGRPAPQGELAPAVCKYWEEVTGDAGWAGVLAETVAGGASREAYIIYPEGCDVLALLREAQALLPAADRWRATFSTHLIKVPPGIDCLWRCVCSNATIDSHSHTSGTALFLDLREPNLKTEPSPFVSAARTGASVPADYMSESVAPAELSAVENHGGEPQSAQGSRLKRPATDRDYTLAPPELPRSRTQGATAPPNLAAETRNGTWGRVHRAIPIVFLGLIFALGVIVLVTAPGIVQFSFESASESDPSSSNKRLDPDDSPVESGAEKSSPLGDRREVVEENSGAANGSSASHDDGHKGNSPNEGKSPSTQKRQPESLARRARPTGPSDKSPKRDQEASVRVEDEETLYSKDYFANLKLYVPLINDSGSALGPSESPTVGYVDTDPNSIQASIYAPGLPSEESAEAVDGSPYVWNIQLPGSNTRLTLAASEAPAAEKKWKLTLSQVKQRNRGTSMLEKGCLILQVPTVEGMVAHCVALSNPPVVSDKVADRDPLARLTFTRESYAGETISVDWRLRADDDVVCQGRSELTAGSSVHRVPLKDPYSSIDIEHQLRWLDKSGGKIELFISATIQPRNVRYSLNDRSLDRLPSATELHDAVASYLLANVEDYHANIQALAPHLPQEARALVNADRVSARKWISTRDSKSDRDLLQLLERGLRPNAIELPSEEAPVEQKRARQHKEYMERVENMLQEVSAFRENVPKWTLDACIWVGVARERGPDVQFIIARVPRAE